MAPSSEWPPTRLRDLDKEMIEFLARLNEDERRRLIEVSHMTPKQTTPLKKFLSHEDEKREAGFRIVTRSVVIAGIVRRVPTLIIGLAAILVALGQIWGWLARYVGRSIK